MTYGTKLTTTQFFIPFLSSLSILFFFSLIKFSLIKRQFSTFFPYFIGNIFLENLHQNFINFN